MLNGDSITTNGTANDTASSSAARTDVSKKGVEETIKRGLGDAQRELDEVRLAIARNLSRALVNGFENPF